MKRSQITVGFRKYKKFFLASLITLLIISAVVLFQLHNSKTIELSTSYTKENFVNSQINKTNQINLIENKLNLINTAATSCGGFTDLNNPFPCCANSGNNTWWAAYTRPDLIAAGLDVIEADQFWAETSTLGFPQGQIPQVGALAAWGKSEMYPNGHLGFVIRVFDNNIFQMSEMNCDRDPRYNPSRIVSTLQFENFQGFIYKKQIGAARIEVRNAAGQLVHSSISIELANGQKFGSDFTAGVYTLSNVWAIPAQITAISEGVSVTKEIVINPNTETTYTVNMEAPPLPAVPTLTAPDNTSVFLEGEVIRFSWEGDGAEYRLEIIGGPTGSIIFPWISQKYIDVNYLAADYSYSWRVRAKNSSGESNWSEAWNITVNKPALTGCSLISGGGIVIFDSENCSGINQRIKSTEFIKLISPLNNEVDSIYVKTGWSVKIFENKDRTGGKLCVTSTTAKLAPLNYSNGTPVFQNGRSTVSAVKVFASSNCQ